MKKIHLQKSTIIKWIGATIVFYLFLMSNVFHVGDSIFPSAKDYINQPEHLRTGATAIDQAIRMETENSGTQDNALLAQTHGAANTPDMICQNNEKICDTAHFVGDYTNKEKINYLANLIKIGRFIDDTLTTNQKVEDTLKQVNISKTSGKRGYANRDSIVLNIGTGIEKNEFFQLLSHEMGHILDLGILQGSSAEKDKNFTEFSKKVFSKDDVSLIFYGLSRDAETIRKAKSTKKDFCSGYGMSDPFEDFAECLNLYLNHNQFFRITARKNPTMGKKYNAIAKLFDGIYINQNKTDATLLQTNSDRRPWDTTRI
ncbi:MAG: hypothetical protein WCJ39_06335 [bacterium]